MGYALIMGGCYSCGRTFSFNPHKVPSIRVNGDRKPICEACMLAANELRKQNGMEPHPINPDAYQPIEEHEL